LSSVTLEYLDVRGGEGGADWALFFRCNVKGLHMQWFINETGYGVFQPGQLRTVHRESLPAFTYTATLLGSSSIMSGIHQLDSIMMVLVQNPATTINVGCASDTDSEVSSYINPSNKNKMQNDASLPSDTARDGMIQLSKLWNRQIVSREDAISNTTCFMCKVNFTSQIWETSNENQLGFDSGNSVGSERSLLSVDEGLLPLQAILIDLSSDRLVSIFFLTDSSVSNVSCNADGTSVSLAQHDSSVDEDMYTAVPEYTQDSDVTSKGKINELVDVTSKGKINELVVLLFVRVLYFLSWEK